MKRQFLEEMIRSENWWEEWCGWLSQPVRAQFCLNLPPRTSHNCHTSILPPLPLSALSKYFTEGEMLFLSLQQKCFRNTFVQKSKSIVCTVAKTSSSPWIVIERWRCKLISFKSISYFYVSAECLLFCEFVLWVAPLLYSFLQSVGPDWLMEASACGY